MTTYTHAELMALKRDNPRAYRLALADLEAAKLGKRQPETVEPIQPADLDVGAPSLGAGVTTMQTNRRGIITRAEHDTATVRGILDQALDYSPDPHYAAHTAKALGLQGWTLDVLTPGTDEPDEAAKAELEAFADRIARHYGGGIDALLEVGLDSVLRHGAVAIELDVADSRDDVADVDLVDPAAIDFQVTVENGHKRVAPVYVPSGGGAPRPLNEHTFAYIGAGVKVGQPRGQSPFLPLVETTYGQTRLRENLTRVAEQQGFSRLAFTVDTDKAIDQAPPDVVRRNPDGTVQVLDWQRYKTYLNGMRSDVEALVRDMAADDTWVMLDTLKAGTVGADHGTQSFKPLEIAQVFDQDSIVACLGQPAIHGRNWGAALSTTGNVQWLVYTLGLEGLRDIPKRAVEWALNQYLRIRGINAVAALAFEPISKSDALADAQAEEVRTRTIAAQLDMGLITVDEAAEMLTGHDMPVDDAGAGEGDGVRVSTETVLNGAQVQAAQQIVAAVADGTLPRDTGVMMLAVFFNLPVELADSIMGAVGRGEPTPPPGGSNGHNGHGERATGGEWTDLLWQRDTTDAAGAAAALAVTERDARRIRREWDRWAQDRAPAFVGLLGATPWTEGRVPRGWVYEVPRAVYRYPTNVVGKLGRVLPQTRLTSVLEKHLAVNRQMIQNATNALVEGRITPAYWERQMAMQIRNAHLEARIAGVGGQFNMAPGDYQAINRTIDQQRQYLKGFVDDIRNNPKYRNADGTLNADRIRWRSQQYLEAPVRGTHQRGLEDRARGSGCDQERNVLSVADHCEQCENLSAMGWQPLGSLPMIGERTCLTNCKCSIEYRREPVSDVTPEPMAIPEAASA